MSNLPFNNEYKLVDVITPIMDFIYSCPFLSDYNISLENMTVQKFSNANSASAIDYVGSNVIDVRDDVTGDRIVKKQANFNILLLRDSTESFMRHEIANFIWNFEQWIEECNYNNSVPRISSVESIDVDERMWADNGAFLTDFDDRDESVYIIQLHIEYYNEYECGY